MKFHIFIIFSILVAAIGLITWYVLASTPAPVSCGGSVPPPRIMAFGDSLVVGHGAGTEGGFISMLAADIGIPIRNRGRGGDTTASARERLDAVLAEEADIVIVLLGGNDALRRVPIEATEANLDLILELFVERGTEVILLGVMGGLPFQDPYPEMFERLARKHDVAYMPNVLSGLIGRSEYMSDSIHPNEAGYRRIADRVHPYLEEACAARSAP